MDRRTALRNITLTLGYTVATPTAFGILQSCKSDVATWTPMFFTETEGYMIIKLSDIILPSSDIAGALDVNAPEFMDKMLNDIAPEEEKNLIKEGANAFANEFQKVYDKSVSTGTTNEYEKLLEKYFNISEEEKRAVFAMKNDNEPISEDQLNKFLIYKFLLATRSYTLYGYYTSEHVGENILSYDPIPGQYDPCIPVEKVGNAWSLS